MTETTSEGRSLRAVDDWLWLLGPFGAASEYRGMVAALSPYWTEDVWCGVHLAVAFLEELADKHTDSNDRDGHYLDATMFLHEATCERGGYTADELLDEEMQEAAVRDGFDRALGLPLTDEVFPEPR